MSFSWRGMDSGSKIMAICLMVVVACFVAMTTGMIVWMITHG